MITLGLAFIQAKFGKHWPSELYFGTVIIDIAGIIATVGIVDIIF